MVDIKDMTPTVKRMWELLKDGEPHKKESLHNLLDDELASASSIQKHITALRKLIAPQGLHIMCDQSNGDVSYRLVRSISNPNSGRK